MPGSSAATAQTKGLFTFFLTAGTATILVVLASAATFLDWDLAPLALRAEKLPIPPVPDFPLDIDEGLNFSGPPSPAANQSAVLPPSTSTEPAQAGSALKAPAAVAVAKSPVRTARASPAKSLASRKPANVCPVPIGEACKCLPLRRRVQSFLSNIVLVIACKNFRPSGASGFLLQVYAPIFPNIVLVAQKPNSAVPPGSYKFLPGHPWDKSYMHLPRVIRDFPNAEGVLWVSDGMALNYWQLLSANKSKLWLSSHRAASWLIPLPPNAAAASFPPWKAVQALNVSLGRQYSRSCGHPRVYPRRTAEVWYLPRRHFATVAKVVGPVLTKHQLPMDVAVPILFFALEHPQQYDKILDNIIVDTSKRTFTAPLTPWSSSVTAVQPWPLGRFSFRMHLLISFSNVDCCVLDILEKPWTRL